MSKVSESKRQPNPEGYSFIHSFISYFYFLSLDDWIYNEHYRSGPCLHRACIQVEETENK